MAKTDFTKAFPPKDQAKPKPGEVVIIDDLTGQPVEYPEPKEQVPHPKWPHPV